MKELVFGKWIKTGLETFIYLINNKYGVVSMNPHEGGSPFEIENYIEWVTGKNFIATDVFTFNQNKELRSIYRFATKTEIKEIWSWNELYNYKYMKQALKNIFEGLIK